MFWGCELKIRREAKDCFWRTDTENLLFCSSKLFNISVDWDDPNYGKMTWNNTKGSPKPAKTLHSIRGETTLASQMIKNQLKVSFEEMAQGRGFLKLYFGSFPYAATLVPWYTHYGDSQAMTIVLSERICITYTCKAAFII